MGKAAEGSRCKSCGTKRGKDHCEPNKMGLSVKNPEHPSNNGEWEQLVSSLKKIKIGVKL